MTCTHTYGFLNSQGEPVKIRYKRMFCPDCGERLKAPGPTKPSRALGLNIPGGWADELAAWPYDEPNQ